MAFVRKVRTASGAVAVQVVRKHRGRREILAHLGSAHTDADLAVLLDRAHAMVEDEQPQLDLGLDLPTPPARMDQVADYRTGQLPVGPDEPGQAAAGTGGSRTLREPPWVSFRLV